MRRSQRSATEIDKKVHKEFAHWFSNRVSFHTKIDVLLNWFLIITRLIECCIMYRFATILTTFMGQIKMFSLVLLMDLLIKLKDLPRSMSMDSSFERWNETIF